MGRNKKIIFSFLLVFGLLFLTSCNINEISAYSNKNVQGDYSADNVYDNDDLILGRDRTSHYYCNYSKSTKDKLTIKELNLSGSSTLLIINVSKDTEMDVKVKATVKSGDYKIVLCSPDNKIKTISEGNTDKIYNVSLSKGRNVIKMVGKKCKVTNLLIEFSNIDEKALISRFKSELDEQVDIFRKECNAGKKIDIEKLADYAYYLTKKENADFMIRYIKENKSLDENKLSSVIYYADKAKVSAFFIDEIKAGKIFKNNLINKLAYYLDKKCISEYLVYVAENPDHAEDIDSLFYYADSSVLNKSLIKLANKKKKIDPDFIKEGAYYLSEEAIGACVLSVAVNEPKQAVRLMKEVAYYMKGKDIAAVLNKLLDKNYEIKKEDIESLEYYLDSSDYEAILKRLF